MTTIVAKTEKISPDALAIKRNNLLIFEFLILKEQLCKYLNLCEKSTIKTDYINRHC